MTKQVKMKKLYCFIFDKYRNFEKPKILSINLIIVSAKMKMKKYSKKKNQLRY